MNQTVMNILSWELLIFVTILLMLILIGSCGLVYELWTATFKKESGK